MSLWRTAEGQDWVLIPLSEQERACVERASGCSRRWPSA